MGKLDLSIAIPFFNEEKNVRDVVNSIVKNVKRLGINYEIILVNNGSTDATTEIIDSLIKKNKNLRKVSLAKNQGYGGGILSGLKIARGSIIGFIDGDGQFGNENVVEAYRKMINENLDLCKGFRIRREDSIARNIMSIFYNLIVRLLFFANIHDINAKPKLMKKECYKNLKLKSKDWFIDTEIMLTAKKKGYKYGEIPLEYKKRKGGKSSLGISAVLQFLKNLLRFRLGAYD